MIMIERRQFLGFAGAGLSLSLFPSAALAQNAGVRRLIFIIQRGAADGLGTIIPVGDPGLLAARSALQVEGGAKLDSMFTLHPSMAETAALYAAKQALFVHAVASPYRDRSHFDAQNVLESGGTAPYALKTGWMNRLVGMLPKGDAKALALSPTIPMAMRGTAQVASYAPSALPDASADLVARVGQLYAGDKQLHSLWEQAVATRNMAGSADDGLNARNAVAMGALAAKLMAGPQGARVAMMETTGWDTHAGQKARLGNQLKGLDGLIGALKTGLGADWANTLVIVATEFGRTVAVNGTGGTDHGTASAAMLLGGAVRGGRVIADWPGLGQSALYEGRDLKPTLSLDALITGAVAGHFGLDPEKAGSILFPEMRTTRPVEGLIRT
jgi:uncharacterized protein (DUF1501 family)